MRLNPLFICSCQNKGERRILEEPISHRSESDFTGALRATVKFSKGILTSWLHCTSFQLVAQAHEAEQYVRKNIVQAVNTGNNSFSKSIQPPDQSSNQSHPQTSSGTYIASSSLRVIKQSTLGLVLGLALRLSCKYSINACTKGNPQRFFFFFFFFNMSSRYHLHR